METLKANLARDSFGGIKGIVNAPNAESGRIQNAGSKNSKPQLSTSAVKSPSETTKLKRSKQKFGNIDYQLAVLLEKLGRQINRQ
jgi:hypothetical protein